MSRWEPNAPERLTRAALELFVDRGYDNVTVAEIAERAGLTKRTFFRHFADKREVLFPGQDILGRLFTDAILGAPAGTTPLDMLGAGLDAVETVFGPERRELVRQRVAIVNANTDLRERELLKRAAIADVMAGALRERGVPDPAASLAAELGNLAFRTAFARWIDPANDGRFGELARQTLEELKAATATLD